MKNEWGSSESRERKRIKGPETTASTVGLLKKSQAVAMPSGNIVLGIGIAV